MGALAGSFLSAPAGLSYDPEAWLVWGREAAAGQLDVTQGPAIKPLPIAWNALAAAVGGSDVAWSLWALVSRAGLVAAMVLGAAVAAGGLQFDRGGDAAGGGSSQGGSDRDRTWRAAGFARGWARLAGAAAVVATPTLLEGALGGGSEALVVAALFGACLFGSAGRMSSAACVLALAALIRPEGLVLLAALAVVLLAQRRLSLVGAAGLVALAGAVTAAWAATQWAGGGDLAGGTAAAAALREGQPGLAARPALATLAGAAFAVPWLIAAAGACWWAGRTAAGGPLCPDRTTNLDLDPDAGSDPRSRNVRAAGHMGSSPAAWPLALGGVWVATVAAMAEAGFSGEVRYLAPGLALLAVGAVATVAERMTERGLSPASRGAAPGAVGLLAGAALAVAALQAVPAIGDHRDLARSQRDLTSLLQRQSVRADIPTCGRVAVPRFLRPAVAWRLRRPIGSLQSPSLRGADCALLRDAAGERTAQGPGRRPRALRATSGAWSWWQQAPAAGGK